jgi:hypothetical protein
MFFRALRSVPQMSFIISLGAISSASEALSPCPASIVNADENVAGTAPHSSSTLPPVLYQAVASSARAFSCPRSAEHVVWRMRASITAVLSSVGDGSTIVRTPFAHRTAYFPMPKCMSDVAQQKGLVPENLYAAQDRRLHLSTLNPNCCRINVSLSNQCRLIVVIRDGFDLYDPDT